MSIEYDLYLATSMKREQLLEMLLELIGELAWSGDKAFLFGPTMNVGVYEPRKSRQEDMEAGYGFVPTLTVWFRRAFDADYDQFYQPLVAATLMLLEHTQDAVLLFNGESTVMQRIGGQLAFDAEMNPGKNEAWLRSRFPLPFECRPLRSPLVEG